MPEVWLPGPFGVRGAAPDTVSAPYVTGMVRYLPHLVVRFHYSGCTHADIMPHKTRDTNTAGVEVIPDARVVRRAVV